MDFLSSLGFSGDHLNWCSSRLVRLENLGDSQTSWVLEEKDKQWLLTKNGNEPLRVNYLSVEKWLAKYCTLQIHLYKNPNLLDMHLIPFAKASFNDGTEAKIFFIENKIYQINEVIFTSEEMKQALKELRNLLKI